MGEKQDTEKDKRVQCVGLEMFVKVLKRVMWKDRIQQWSERGKNKLHYLKKQQMQKSKVRICP